MMRIRPLTPTWTACFCFCVLVLAAFCTSGLYVNGTLAVISTAPPAFGSVVTLGDGNFRLTFSGPTGQDYELCASTNFALTPVTLCNMLNSGTFG